MTTQIEVTTAGGWTQSGPANVEDTLSFSATVAPSALNQVVDTSAYGGQFVTIVPGEPIYFAIGKNPVATADPRRAAPAGVVRSFLLKFGEKVAVVAQ